MAETRKYEFNWNVINTDMGAARPRLGEATTVEIYRLFQFSLRDILEKEFGTDEADRLFRTAGVLAGKEFYKKYFANVSDLSQLVRSIQDKFRELGIGIVRFEKTDAENMDFQLTVDEDLDCSGLPDSQDQICVYDEGFIKGILDSFTGKNFAVKEVDCWCSNARTCRFRANLDEQD